MHLGAIADDLTGATDLALMLSREGMKTVQVIGLPTPEMQFGDADAVVVALKSRTIAVEAAVAQSLAAAHALTQAGASQLFFKYCSTFDSTDAGNIGPVTEALLDFTGSGITIACPAFPAAGRSIYMGHLFVGDLLLSDSSMKDHPLTPMRDSNLRQVLQRQCQGAVGLVPFAVVERGPLAIRAAIATARAEGKQIVVVDALHDDHLRSIGAACADMRLVTGGSGIALGLPHNFRVAGQLGDRAAMHAMSAPPGKPVILAGSCAAATRGQIQSALLAGTPSLQIDAMDVADGKISAETVSAWVIENTGERACLVYSSAEPAVVKAVQAKIGIENAGLMIENILACVSRNLLANGFSRFVVAGGETSGAVVGALGVSVLEIGPEIDPGVPWTRSIGVPDVALALKSGNFGTPDFFLKALSLLS